MALNPIEDMFRVKMETMGENAVLIIHIRGMVRPRREMIRSRLQHTAWMAKVVERFQCICDPEWLPRYNHPS